MNIRYEIVVINEGIDIYYLYIDGIKRGSWTYIEAALETIKVWNENRDKI